jgi:hypothetical protein
VRSFGPIFMAWPKPCPDTNSACGSKAWSFGVLFWPGQSSAPVDPTTALDASVNPDVADMAQKDPKMGAEWEKAIAEYLNRK